MNRLATTATVAALGLGVCLGPSRAEGDRSAVAAPAGTVVLAVHAVGAQIYACKPDAQGHLAWAFREPIAALFNDGKTVGRHFAGPAWEMADGSLVEGKVVDKAPGAAPGDIPWLRLDVSRHQGDGVLGNVTTVQRVATHGGDRSGPCATAGALEAVPYAADYVFSRR